MFIALRDLRHARGRFALLGGAIALMTFMVVLLSGLTAGLGAASISAVAALPVDHISFQRPPDGQKVAFTTSTLPVSAVRAIAEQPGVAQAYGLGLSATRLQVGTRSAAVTLIGTDAALLPELASGAAPADLQAAVPRSLAEQESLQLGDEITVSGQPVRVAAIVADTSFNHLPVIYTSLASWQRLARTNTITVVAANLNDEVAAAVDTSVGTSTVTRSAAFAAVGGYASEQGSLTLMRTLLLVVSALIVGAFFTVWTMQRAHDLAVVRAIGASRGYLLRDALGQAAIVLLAGAASGGLVAIAVATLASRVVPLVVDLTTVSVPVAAMVAVGLLGAVIAVRRVSGIDPLAALGAAR